MVKTYPKKIEELSPKDLNTFIDFKTQAESLLSTYPEFHTQYHLFRFFRNQKFKIKDSLKAIKKFTEIRDEINMDQLKNLQPEELKMIKDSSGVVKWGYDKQGRPVEIRRLAHADFKLLMDKDNRDHLLNFFTQYYERILFIELPLASKRKGSRVEKIFVITDFKGVKFKTILSKKFKQFMSYVSFLAQESYPEITGRNFVVNAPSMVKGMFNLSNSWLSGKKSQTVSFHTSVPYDKLDEFINIKGLPTFLGGNVKEEDRPESQEVKMAIEQSIIDRSFFLKNRKCEYDFFYTKEERKEKGVEKKRKGSWFEEDMEEGRSLICKKEFVCRLSQRMKF